MGLVLGRLPVEQVIQTAQRIEERLFGHPCNLHELGLVLSLLDGNGDYKRGGISSLYQAGRALEAQKDILRRALGQGVDEELARRLREVAAHDRIAMREAEWEINKHLRSDRE
jgi:hypothetical protein